jgi:hypothetical protein
VSSRIGYIQVAQQLREDLKQRLQLIKQVAKARSGMHCQEGKIAGLPPAAVSALKPTLLMYA